MSTTIRFERGPMASAAHLTHDDGGSAWVFCSLPGGRPWFAFDPQGRSHTDIVNAPVCETHREFVRFVRERFG